MTADVTKAICVINLIEGYIEKIVNSSVFAAEYCFSIDLSILSIISFCLLNDSITKFPVSASSVIELNSERELTSLENIFCVRLET